jgi:hypothetical protein
MNFCNFAKNRKNEKVFAIVSGDVDAGFGLILYEDQVLPVFRLY